MKEGSLLNNQFSLWKVRDPGFLSDSDAKSPKAARPQCLSKMLSLVKVPTGQKKTQTAEGCEFVQKPVTNLTSWDIQVPQLTRELRFFFWPLSVGLTLGLHRNIELSESPNLETKKSEMGRRRCVFFPRVWCGGPEKSTNHLQPG